MEDLNPLEVGTLADADTPEPIVIPDEVAPDVPPTVAEAMAMFAERPDLSAVLTDEGWMRRDGTMA